VISGRFKAVLGDLRWNFRFLCVEKQFSGVLQVLSGVEVALVNLLSSSASFKWFLGVLCDFCW
jgi:hypothetical protein